MAIAPIIKASAHLITPSAAPSAPGVSVRNYRKEEELQRLKDERLHRQALERNRESQAFDLARDRAKAEADAARDAARFARDKEMYGIKSQGDLANWYRQQEFAEQQRLEAENLKYGIPVGADISAEERAKIINGKGAYKYFYGRTPKEEEDIQALEDSIAKDTASPTDRQVLEHRLGVYEIEHPMRGMAIPVPKEEMPPQVMDIGGAKYMFNNGKWEMVNDSNADRDLRNRDLDMRRKDLEAKRYQDAILKIEQGKKVTQMVKEPGSLDSKAVTVTVPYTDEEKTAILKRLFPDRALPESTEAQPLTTQRVNPVTGLLEVALNGAPTNPMVGGSEAQPPSVAPTPAPTPTPTPTPTNGGAQPSPVKPISLEEAKKRWGVGFKNNDKQF